MGRLELVRSGQIRSGQTRPSQVKSSQVKSGQDRSSQVRLGQDRSSQVRLGQIDPVAISGRLFTIPCPQRVGCIPLDHCQSTYGRPQANFYWVSFYTWIQVPVDASTLGPTLQVSALNGRNIEVSGIL